MNRSILIRSLALLLLAGCELWRPPIPTDEELDNGLIVMYPGAFNTTTEYAGVYTGLREAGIDHAIEIVPWAAPLANFFNPADFLPSQRPWAENEAQRIADYSTDHPDGPVTLVGYSGGTMMCALVAEHLPLGASIDWIIMLGPGISPTYDLTPMLDRTDRGAYVFWSPLDTFTSNVTQSLGTLDGIFGPSAATFSFTTKHPKLTQIEWTSAFLDDGNDGGHTGYITSANWIRDFVAPVITSGQ